MNTTDKFKLLVYFEKSPEGLIKETYCGVMVIVVGNRHGDTSSNPGPD